MERLLKAVFVLLVAFASVGLGAAANENEKVYQGLMGDSALYTGEGIVALDAYGSDLGKARSSARERARASLVESIKVRVVSQVKDTQSSGPGGEKQTIESQSVSIADLEVEEIRYDYFENFPKKGQLTVVASLGKADYERQLVGKRASRFRPEWGLGVVYQFSTYFYFDEFFKEQSRRIQSGAYILKPGINTPGGSTTDSVQGIGLQFRYREFSLLISNELIEGLTVATYDSTVGQYGLETKNLEIIGAELGWDYAPWALRLQPYLPLRARLHHVGLGGYDAWVTGLATGLGLRYWASDSFFLDFSGRYVQSLNRAELQRQGRPISTGPASNVAWCLSAAQWQVNLTWTGF